MEGNLFHVLADSRHQRLFLHFLFSHAVDPLSFIEKPAQANLFFVVLPDMALDGFLMLLILRARSEQKTFHTPGGI
ncbi:hypothetical protein [Thalassobacillus pellis]|uniref:hypothetical protein n=1 Tax=Thalassobacillus pellis TaxID=748008 RepID=UPI00196186DE|nr:hypothetical protein [Thalassobacillus pellis]MBM7552788.1 hypothetical protein [Thalassobacillus pellis]